MSNGNVDAEVMLARALEALNARDVDALMMIVDPELEFRSRLTQVEGREYRGRQGIEDFLSDVDEAWADVAWSVDEIIGWRGDDLVLVVRNKARGETSGAPFEVPTFHVWSFRDGRPWRGSAYESRDEALEAAELPE
jgi:ketosteroid isomerase-like protein